MNKLTQIKTTPTLDDLAVDPALAKALSSEQAKDMLTRLMAIQPILMVQIVYDGGNVEKGAMDRLLKAEEVADLLGTEVDWIYRKASDLPFTRRLSPGQLRFSKKGLEKYIKNLPV
jgi:predicted DNA-binding transcriptional regulator AlpA